MRHRYRFTSLQLQAILKKLPRVERFVRELNDIPPHLRFISNGIVLDLLTSPYAPHYIITCLSLLLSLTPLKCLTILPLLTELTHTNFVMRRYIRITSAMTTFTDPPCVARKQMTLNIISFLVSVMRLLCPISATRYRKAKRMKKTSAP